MTFEGLFLLSKIQFIYSIWFLGSLVLDMQVFVLIAHSWNFIHVFVPYDSCRCSNFMSHCCQHKNHSSHVKGTKR